MARKRASGSAAGWLVLALVALVALVAAGAGCGATDAAPHAPRVLHLAHGLSPSHPVHRAMQRLASRLEELSGGRLRLLLYPSEQLGSERECLELLQFGSLDMTKVSAAVLEGFVPAYRLWSTPYLFRDDAQRWRVLLGPVGREVLRAGDTRRLHGLAYYDAGSRSFYTRDRPVRTPADLRGLKVRTQESPSAVALVEALGGAPTPLAWGELYTALQQGVVDAAENNPPSFRLSRHFEVARYLSLDEHTAVPDVLLIGTPSWERLTPRERGWLEQAAADSVELERRLWREATEDALRTVRAAGVQVLRPDKAPFVQATAGLRAELERDPRLGPLLRRAEVE